jgi:Fic family protein
MQQMSTYIHENKDWPNFKWQSEEIINLLSKARNLQGRLLGKMESMGFDFRDEALLETLTQDVIKSSEIEGDILNPEQVRSSIAQRLGIDYSGTIQSDRDVDGMVELMIDATKNCFHPMNKERLFDWHAGLFPTGRSGIFKIIVAEWRKDLTGNMQVVSGRAGKEKIHFEAPSAERIDYEMQLFIDWFNKKSEVDLVIKASIAHVWFVTIHPFQDGNGRITRALTDMMLAQSDHSTQRFYSMSSQIRKERKEYYEILEKTQKGNLDITNWIMWFLNCLINCLNSTDEILNKVLTKSKFWQTNASLILNERQKKLINRLLDGFEGKLTSSKWAKIAKCSRDSAIRDINDLVSKEVLLKKSAGGRSTNYVINFNYDASR